MAEKQNWIRGWFKKFFEPQTFVAILLFLATIALYSATRDLVKGADDTAQRQLRAYVAISNSVPLDMNPIRVALTFDNFGQTPATDVKVFFYWEFVPFGENLPSNFTFPEKPGCVGAPGITPGIAAIFPRNPALIFRKHCPDELTRLQASERNEVHAFLYGHAEYLDIFKKKRRTNFCLLYTPSISIVCGRHNEMDPEENS
jgi:hypothetical protein